MSILQTTTLTFENKTGDTFEDFALVGQAALDRARRIFERVATIDINNEYVGQVGPALFGMLAHAYMTLATACADFCAFSPKGPDALDAYHRAADLLKDAGDAAVRIEMAFQAYPLSEIGLFKPALQDIWRKQIFSVQQSADEARSLVMAAQHYSYWLVTVRQKRKAERAQAS